MNFSENDDVNNCNNSNNNDDNYENIMDNRQSTLVSIFWNKKLRLEIFEFAKRDRDFQASLFPLYN